MTTGKRYYWLRLKDDFFSSKRIKKLREMAGGDTYLIIYLKMQLLAMKTEGVLSWTGLEDKFTDELALDLDEKPDDVAVTLMYLLKTGLAETSDDVNFFFPYAVENTGSEGASAERVRAFRKRQTLHGNASVTPMKQICNGEKEIEKEKELKKELEIEKEIKKSADAPRHPYGEYGWVKLTDQQYQKLLTDLGPEELNLCIRYVDESAQKTKNRNKWQDWNLVIRNCHREDWPKRWRKQDERTTNNIFLQIYDEGHANEQ